MTSDNETALTALTDEYNASQDQVRVRPGEPGRLQADDRQVRPEQPGQPARPRACCPSTWCSRSPTRTPSCRSAACIEASGYDTSAFLDRALRTYQTEGVQWSMPFNVSKPGALLQQDAVRPTAGLDPDDPPVTLDAAAGVLAGDRRRAGRRRCGIALDSGVDSGGGWFLEQWFARAGEPYADNGNGRLGAGDAGAVRRPARRRAADRRAVDDQRRPGRDVGDNAERPGRAAQAGRPGEPGGDGDRHVGRARHRQDRRSTAG